jgi:hypothetical protein
MMGATNDAHFTVPSEVHLYGVSHAAMLVDKRPTKSMDYAARNP